MAHDESNTIEMGALVRIVESRPMSRHKRWVVEEVLAAQSVAEVGELADEAIVQGTDEEEAS
jgi:small subunit ribosomal protein S17